MYQTGQKHRLISTRVVHLLIYLFSSKYTVSWAGPRSAVGNVSGYRCVSDCRSRGREFDPGPVPYFHGDWSVKVNALPNKCKQNMTSLSLLADRTVARLEILGVVF